LTRALLQCLDELTFWHGRRQQKPLSVVKTHRLRRAQLLHCLNALGTSEVSKSVRQIYDGLAQRRIALIHSTIRHE